MADQETLFKEACTHLLSNNFSGAIEGFRALLEEHGDHPTVRHNLALSHECSGDFVAAAAEYNAVITAFPTYMPSLLGLANCCLYASDVETAEGLAMTAKKTAPSDPRACIMVSEILFLRGKDADGIREHQAAVDAVDASYSVPTQSHAQCHVDLGYDGHTAPFHMFLENSLIQRNAFPDIAPPSKTDTRTIIYLAHTGNAADIARRLTTLLLSTPRSAVYLVTLDEIASRILAEYVPDATICNFRYEAHELPAVALFVGRHLLRGGCPILLPADDGRRDADKLAWANTSCTGSANIVISIQGDVAANPAAAEKLDPRRVPPMFRRGSHPDPAVFAKIFE